MQRLIERELLVTERGKGAYLYPLNESLAICDVPKRLEVSTKTSLEGGIVYIDALFNAKTSVPKLRFMQELVTFGIGVDRKNNVGIRMTGSNIDQQRQVAAGRAHLGLIDAVGGPYDWIR
jgi:hypothetical protein